MSDDNRVIRDVKEDISTKEIASRVKLINLSVEHFWKRWAREYLVSLRETHKMKAQSKSVVVKPGDAVMIHDDGLKRSRWAMGIVEETISGNDGVIRGARLRRLSSDGNQQVSNVQFRSYIRLRSTTRSIQRNLLTRYQERCIQ